MRNSSVRKRHDSAEIKEMAGNILKMTKNDQNGINNSPSPVDWTSHDNISYTSASRLSSFDRRRTIRTNVMLIKISIKDMCFFCAILKTWKHAWSTSFGIANKYFPFASPRKLDSGDKRNIKVDFPLDESVLLRCPASMPDKKAINCIRYFSGWVFHFTFKNVKWKFFTQFSWRTKLFIQYYYHNEQFISGLSHSGGLVVSALDSGSSGFVLCSWTRRFTLPLPLSTQVYKWIPASLMLAGGGDPAMD